jgi:hypothetical protein
VWRTPLTQLTGAADAHIDARTTGMWVTPGQDGHGLVLEVIPLDGVATLVASWFVYDHGAPLWLVGVGRIDGAKAHVVVSGAGGTGFPPAFDAGKCSTRTWGALDFELSSDRAGTRALDSTLSAFRQRRAADRSSSSAPTCRRKILPAPRCVPATAATGTTRSKTDTASFLDVFHLPSVATPADGRVVRVRPRRTAVPGRRRPIDGDRANVTLGISHGPQFPPPIASATCSAKPGARPISASSTRTMPAWTGRRRSPASRPVIWI